MADWDSNKRQQNRCRNPFRRAIGPFRRAISETLSVFFLDAAVDACEAQRSATVVFDDQVCLDVAYVDVAGAVINYYAAMHMLHGNAAGTLFN